MNRYLLGNPLNLIRSVYSYGGVSFSRVHIFLLYLLKSFVFLPLSVGEYLFYSKRIAKSEINQSPIFILGHNRSGTTLLHKLMIHDSQFGYCKNSDMLFSYVNTPVNGHLKKWFQKLLNFFGVKSFAYRDTGLVLDDPQEEDMCMTAMFMPASSYWGFVYPNYAKKNFKRYVYFDQQADERQWIAQYSYFLKKISFKNGGKRLILKNPANTARIATLSRMFPDARFIFIHRKPESVFYSTKRIWDHAINELGLQKASEKVIFENIYFHYQQMHDFYEKGKSVFEENQLCEISYAELEKSPLATLKKVYNQLGIGDFNLLKPNFEQQLAQEKSYKKFVYHQSEELNESIRKRLKKYYLKWNY